MEVDPDVPTMTAPMNGRDVSKAGLSPVSGSQFYSGTTVSPLAHQSHLHRLSLEGSSPALRSLPAPPVVLITNSDCAAWPKFKLDQLFVEWLARPESQKWLGGLLDDVRAGKSPHLGSEQGSRALRSDRSSSPSPSRSPSSGAPSGPGVSPQQAPGSPVSRLFRNHIPFGDSDSSPHSPSHGLHAISSAFRPTLSPAAAEFDLGRSGSASPIEPDQTFHKEVKLHSSSKRTAPMVQGSSIGPTAGEPSGHLIDTRLEMNKSRALAADGSPHSRQGTGQPVADSKALDRVADGIAGMTAVVGKDQNGAQVSDVGGDKSSHVEIDALDQRGKPIGIFSKDRGMGSSSGSRIESSESPVRADSEHQTGKAFGEKGTVGGQRGSVEPASEAAKRKLNSRLETGRARAGETVSILAPQEVVHGTAGRSAQDNQGILIEERHVSAGIPPLKPPTLQKDATMTDSGSSGKRKTLPRFYFPCGKDAEERERRERNTIAEFFRTHRMQRNSPNVSRTDIAELVVDAIGLPSYFASIVFNAVLELFPKPSQAEAEISHQLSDDGQKGSRTQSEETAMRDITSREDGVGGVRAGQLATSRNEASGTNSDTTMGDVNDVHCDGRRVNGFHASSGAQVDSTPPLTEPESTGNGNAGGGSQLVNGNDVISEEQFTAYYNKIAANASREARLFAALREPHAKRDYLIPSDFKPLLRALLFCHQGLAFLHATPEFQQRYSETVIERIYFGCTRQHNGRLTLADIKRSKLLETLIHVDEEEDINRERKYFSYEHFYVLYCRFWELDANHDLQIDREDLMRYGSHSLTYRIVDRIFGGYARPLDCPENPGFMSYTDFIWFCLSEEDKTSDTAIDYWFRCVDMDGDGLITMYDMEFFYTEQLHRMECFGHEPVQIPDILCQLLDMIKPNMKPPVIRRRDLKKCKLAGNFFNVLFNLNKFFAIEARDPLQIRQEHATPDLTDWDRFAALEYLRLSAEEEGEEDESWEDVCEAANPLMAGEAPF